MRLMCSLWPCASLLLFYRHSMSCLLSLLLLPLYFLFFFFNDTATTEIYTLSLHDALPISSARGVNWNSGAAAAINFFMRSKRSEEHTSELQSHVNLVCRLLLEKKKKKIQSQHPYNPITCMLPHL